MGEISSRGIGAPLNQHDLHRRSFIVTSDSEKEQRYQLETIVEYIVHCVSFVSRPIPGYGSSPVSQGKGGHADLCFVPVLCHALRG